MFCTTCKYAVVSLILAENRTRVDVTSSSAKPKDVGMKLLTPPLGMSFTVIYLITPGSFYNEKKKITITALALFKWLT